MSAHKQTFGKVLQWRFLVFLIGAIIFLGITTINYFFLLFFFVFFLAASYNLWYMFTAWLIELHDGLITIRRPFKGSKPYKQYKIADIKSVVMENTNGITLDFQIPIMTIHFKNGSRTEMSLRKMDNLEIYRLKKELGYHVEVLTPQFKDFL